MLMTTYLNNTIFAEGEKIFARRKINLRILIGSLIAYCTRIPSDLHCEGALLRRESSVYWTWRVYLIYISSP